MPFVVFWEMLVVVGVKEEEHCLGMGLTARLHEAGNDHWFFGSKCTRQSRLSAVECGIGNGVVLDFVVSGSNTCGRRGGKLGLI